MKVLIPLPHYLPGFKAGGPIRSIANLVAGLGDKLGFYIVTRDRDLGDERAYPDIATNSWQSVGKAHVAYVAPGVRSLAWLVQEVNGIAPDIVYLNSFFDWRFCALPQFLARGGLMSSRPTILAPRGQFSEGALQLNRWKKRAYLAGFKSLRLPMQLVWHCTSEAEREDVVRLFGPRTRCFVAPNICEAGDDFVHQRPEKRQNELRLVFLSRISRKKNLARAIDELRTVNGRVSLDIWGPIEDVDYWRACQQRIAALPANVCVSHRGAVAPSRVLPTLAQYDALLLPTLGENYGHVIAEAISVGCPVVISDRTPWRGLTQLGVGWDLPLEAEQVFGRALSKLCAMDEPAHRTMRAKIAEFGRSFADVAPIVDQYREMFLEAARPAL